MVSEEPARGDRRPAPHTESEAEGPLRLLRDHREFLLPGPIPSGRDPDLEEMAVPARPGPLHVLGSADPPAGALPAPAGAGDPLGAPSCSESMIRGAVCVNRASTDLWGLRAGNRPGLPGPFAALLSETRAQHRQQNSLTR